MTTNDTIAAIEDRLRRQGRSQQEARRDAERWVWENLGLAPDNKPKPEPKQPRPQRPGPETLWHLYNEYYIPGDKHPVTCIKCGYACVIRLGYGSRQPRPICSHCGGAKDNDRLVEGWTVPLGTRMDTCERCGIRVRLDNDGPNGRETECLECRVWRRQYQHGYHIDNCGMC